MAHEVLRLALHFEHSVQVLRYSTWEVEEAEVSEAFLARVGLCVPCLAPEPLRWSARRRRQSRLWSTSFCQTPDPFVRYPVRGRRILAWLARARGTPTDHGR